jgi:hypothetical protein
MPKRVRPLSAKALAAVRPSDKTIELVDGYMPGLRLRILPSGKRTWSLSIRDSKGSRRRFDLGFGLSLAEAHRKAERIRPTNAGLHGSEQGPLEKVTAPLRPCSICILEKDREPGSEAPLRPSK